ncbi:MAG: hypothetical protein VB996_00930 [Pseudomonadales bacterium]
MFDHKHPGVSGSMPGPCDQSKTARSLATLSDFWRYRYTLLPDNDNPMTLELAESLRASSFVYLMRGGAYLPGSSLGIRVVNTIVAATMWLSTSLMHMPGQKSG